MLYGPWVSTRILSESQTNSLKDKSLIHSKPTFLIFWYSFKTMKWLLYTGSLNRTLLHSLVLSIHVFFQLTLLAVNLSMYGILISLRETKLKDWNDPSTFSVPTYLSLTRRFIWFICIIQKLGKRETLLGM